MAKSLADVVSISCRPTPPACCLPWAILFPPACLPTRNDGTDGDFEQRAGDHHDGMEWFGLSANGSRDDNATEPWPARDEPRNHHGRKISSSSCTPTAAHPPARPAAEVDKETAIHGVRDRSEEDGGKWAYVPGSAKNRLTALTHRHLTARRGSSQLVTKFSPTGTKTRGTLNNCGTGKTPGAPSRRAKKTGLATSPAALPTTQPAATTRA